MSLHFDDEIDPIKEGYQNMQMTLNELRTKPNNWLSILPNDIFKIIFEMSRDSLDLFGTHQIDDICKRLIALKKHDLIIKINHNVWFKFYEISYINSAGWFLILGLRDINHFLYLDIYDDKFRVLFDRFDLHTLNAHPYNKIELFYRKHSLGRKIRKFFAPITNKLHYKSRIF